MEAPADGPTPGKVKRPIGLTVAAYTCWFVGIHAVLVPGVIVYLLVEVCREEGWRDILTSGPGLALIVMTLLSSLSTLTWMTAGRAYFRNRSRRGRIHALIATGSALLTGIAVAYYSWQ